MKMMYRKPMVKIMDRHTLIELDGDFTDYEIGHLLNKAYLNHKAPHEYDELKRYIRDLVIGKHNSVYIMNNGDPNPISSASVLGTPYLSTIPAGTGLTYDWLGVSEYFPEIGLTNNSTNCGSNNYGVTDWNPTIYGYNNGNAIEWALYYTTTPFNKLSVSSPLPGLSISPTSYYTSVYVSPKYAYAPYITSNNPLTLSTYYYWYSSSSQSYNYVYFNISFDNCYTGAASPCPGKPSIMPLFFSSGSFTFQASTYYIGMWQWTYT
jgi:hypothetical protein